MLQHFGVLVEEEPPVHRLVGGRTELGDIACRQVQLGELHIGERVSDRTAHRGTRMGSLVGAVFRTPSIRDRYVEVGVSDAPRALPYWSRHRIGGQRIA